MNRKSGFYPPLIALICIFIINIWAVKHPVAAQENNVKDLQKQQKIVIGLLPERNSFEQRNRYEAMARYISKYLDIKVILYALPQYESIFEAFNDEMIDAAFMGGFADVLLRDVAPGEVLARPVWPDGSSTERGYIVARKDSGIKSVADMKDKSLVLVDKASTAGYLYPAFYMKEHAIHDIYEFFSHIYFSGSHDGAAWAVYKGEADVGACKATIYQSLAGEYPQFKEQMVILAESFQLPSSRLVVRNGLDKGLKERLRNLLLGLDKSEEGRSVLKDMGAVKFVAPTDEDYRPVYQMIDNLKLNLDVLLERD